jgi:hypothetical protein
MLAPEKLDESGNKLPNHIFTLKTDKGSMHQAAWMRMTTCASLGNTPNKCGQGGGWNHEATSSRSHQKKKGTP